MRGYKERKESALLQDLDLILMRTSHLEDKMGNLYKMIQEDTISNQILKKMIHLRSKGEETKLTKITEISILLMMNFLILKGKI